VTGRRGLGWLLAGAARLLPPGRREWGSAMRAELAGIQSRRERSRFALGCLRAIVMQSAAPRRAGYPLLTAAVLAATAVFTRDVGYAPLHRGLFGLVVTLMTAAWVGRLAAPLRPSGRAARVVRACGYLLVAALASGVFGYLHRNSDAEAARAGAPVFTVVLTGYLLAFLAFTAQRTAATERALAAGAGAGAGAAALFTLLAVVFGPIPEDVTPAVGLVVIAMFVAAAAASGVRSQRQAVLAALCAGTVTALSVCILVAVLSTFGPAQLIPDLAPAALSPADDLAQSRDEVQDPYVWLLLLGWFIAIAVCIAALATRQPRATDEPRTLVHRSPGGQ
jgi:hypothetical protein